MYLPSAVGGPREDPSGRSVGDRTVAVLVVQHQPLTTTANERDADGQRLGRICRRRGVHRVEEDEAAAAAFPGRAHHVEGLRPLGVGEEALDPGGTLLLALKGAAVGEDDGEVL